MTRAPILDPKWPWYSASSHSDPELFRARMEKRRAAAQTKPVASVTALKPKKETSK